MGVQQILLLALSVILVGAAIAVGIDMFNRQDQVSNRSAAATEAQLYLTQVLQFYKMPRTLGGLSNSLATTNADSIAAYIGWADNPMEHENASFQLIIPTPTAENEFVDIKAIGKSVYQDKKPVVHGRITFPDGVIISKVGTINRDQSFGDFDLFATSTE